MSDKLTSGERLAFGMHIRALARLDEDGEGARARAVERALRRLDRVGREP